MTDKSGVQHVDDRLALIIMADLSLGCLISLPSPILDLLGHPVYIHHYTCNNSDMYHFDRQV